MKPVATVRDVRQFHHYCRYTDYGGASDDIFAVNPVRRSFFISAGSWAMLIVPATLLNGEAQALLLIGFGWLAAAGIVFVTPIFFWLLAEIGWRSIQRRRHPMIDELALGPRAYGMLKRYGYETIESVDRTHDTSFLLLSNMDARTVHEIRRAVNIWKYQRWQERGFPAGETPDSVI